MCLSENDVFVLEQRRAPFPERVEKYSQDERTSNKDQGKFFGSTAKTPRVGAAFPGALPDSWLRASGAQGEPKDQPARATKGQSGEGGVRRD